jgi:hypothetical protein
MIRIADDHVVKHLDFQELTRADKIAGNFDISLRRLRLSRRMVVLCDAPSYVQCSALDTRMPPVSRAKGMLWIRLSRSLLASQSGLSAH